MIQLEVRPPELFEVEEPFSPLAAGVAEEAPSVGVANQAVERARELVRVPRANEDSRLAVDDELRDAAHVGGDDGQAGGHCLEDRDGKALGPAREDEHIGTGKQLRYVVPLALQPHAAVEAQLPHQLLQRRPIGTIAHDQRLEPVGRQDREGLQQRGRVLGRLQAADRDERRPPRLVASTRCTGDVDRVVDHDGPFGVAGVGGDSAASSVSETQIVAVVSGRMSRSAHR